MGPGTLGEYSNPWTFGGSDLEDFELRRPEPDEMLAAVQESVRLSENPQPRNTLQERYSTLEPRSMLPYLEGRISEFFIDRFQHLL